MELCRKASINRDVSLSVSLSVFSVRVPGCLVLNSSSRLSVALRALCCVQVDHLELCQVTAAAARLLANHHLEHNTASQETVQGSSDSQSQVITSHNTQHRYGNPAALHADIMERCNTLIEADVSCNIQVIYFMKIVFCRVEFRGNIQLPPPPPLAFPSSIILVLL